MAEKDTKAAGGTEAASAKAPMFSKTGLMILVGAVVASAAGTGFLMSKEGGGGGHTVKIPEASVPADRPGPSGTARTWANNTVVLDNLQVKYRDTGGMSRRTFTMSVVLEIRTDAPPPESGGGGHGGGGGKSYSKAERELQEKDAERKRRVEAQVHWIKDKIYDILRGKGPEDFATNEMIEQVKQQIKRTINDEKFPKENAIEAVLFPEQGF